MRHSRWTPPLPLSLHGTQGVSPSVPPHRAVPCHSMLEAAWESQEGPGLHRDCSTLPDQGPPPQKAARAGQADPRANLPARLFFHQSRAGASSRLLQMFGRSPGREARRFQPPGRHAATATSLPGCPLSRVLGLQRPCARLQGRS